MAKNIESEIDESKKMEIKDRVDDNDDANMQEMVKDVVMEDVTNDVDNNHNNSNKDTAGLQEALIGRGMSSFLSHLW